MRRKFTATLSLYIAGMIMLVFAMLPHHHHNSFICFNSSHCEQTAENSTKSDSHEHDPFSHEGGCVKHLFQTEIERGISLRHDDSCHGACHHFTIPAFVLAGFINALLFETTTDAFPDAQDEALPSVLYAADLSGRAPPFI